MKNLFENTKINNMNVKNHFVKAATWEGIATDDGHLTPQLTKIYKDTALGGVGTILTSFAHVSSNEHPAPNMLGIYDDSFIEEYKNFTDMIHETNTKVIMQIANGGIKGTPLDNSNIVYGPSETDSIKEGIIIKELSKSQIENIIKDFTNAAVRAEKAGFDGVEIHGAHIF